MMTIRFREKGKLLGTRVDGREIRQTIISSFSKKEKVVFDFSEVEVVSNSFADECIGCLITEYGLDFVRQCTTFKNPNPTVRAVISNVVKNRLHDM